eukprot:GILJ01009992.1.p1 GENE.GILJ01009992.1~~GILJ01009992.1.p1  ORF type:complete len:583 (-),score=40.16 GILJ01009992.1:95-1801(-)
MATGVFVLSPWARGEHEALTKSYPNTCTLSDVLDIPDLLEIIAPVNGADLVRTLSLLPVSSRIHVIHDCGIDSGHFTGQSQDSFVSICPKHSITRSSGRYVVRDSDCCCKSKRQVKFSRIPASDKEALSCCFIVMRTTTKLRVVITSQSLFQHQSSWELRMGWSHTFDHHHHVDGLASTKSSNTTTSSTFSSDLAAFLSALGVSGAFCSSFDFSSVGSGMRLVSSVPLSTPEASTDFLTSGHPRIADILNDFPWFRDVESSIDVYTSHVDSTTTSFLREFAWSMVGRTDNPPRLEQLRICYPTSESIPSSIPVAKWFRSQFNCLDHYRTARHLFYQPPLTGCGMNDSMVTVLNANIVRCCLPRTCWMYLGSHTFSRSAWGSVTGKSEGNRHICVEQYNLGIFIEGTDMLNQRLPCINDEPVRYRPLDIPFAVHSQLRVLQGRICTWIKDKRSEHGTIQFLDSSLPRIHIQKHVLTRSGAVRACDSILRSPLHANIVVEVIPSAKSASALEVVWVLKLWKQTGAGSDVLKPSDLTDSEPIVGGSVYGDDEVLTKPSVTVDEHVMSLFSD